MIDIAEKIKAIRNEKRLTQKEVAEELGVTLNGYQKIENSSDIGFLRLQQIADVFKMSVVEIINYPNEEKNINNSLLDSTLERKRLLEDTLIFLSKYDEYAPNNDGYLDFIQYYTLLYENVLLVHKQVPQSDLEKRYGLTLFIDGLTHSTTTTIEDITKSKSEEALAEWKSLIGAHREKVWQVVDLAIKNIFQSYYSIFEVLEEFDLIEDLYYKNAWLFYKNGIPFSSGDIFAQISMTNSSSKKKTIRPFITKAKEME